MVAASLTNGDHVHDLVEAAVAGERDPVPEHLPAGGLYGSNPSVGGEMPLAREATYVTDDADDLGRQDRPDTEDLGEGGARGFDL